MLARSAVVALSVGVVASVCGAAYAAAKEYPAIVVAWDDTGDFGPGTPGTKTAGWQEALDACVAQSRDLYVKGGFGGRKAIYNVSETIRVPATQDFRIDGGLYVLNWTGPADDPSKDLMLIDSTMNGEYHFGIFVYGGAGAAMHIRPEHPVPVDNFVTFIETSITSTGGLADPKPFEAGERLAGTGLLLDGTKAAIVASRFDFVGGILNFKTCIETRGPFVQNQFDCRHLHTNASKSTLFRMGPGASQNIVSCVIGVDPGATEVRGFDIAGVNNTFKIQSRGGGFGHGQDVVLNESASGNRVEFIQGNPGAFDPTLGITDLAKSADNLLTWVGGSIAISTLAIDKSPFEYTQRLYPATLCLDGGKDVRVEFVRHDKVVDMTSRAAAGLVLSPGDKIRVQFSEAPKGTVVPGRP